jgi:hypothetical protein
MTGSGSTGRQGSGGGLINYWMGQPRDARDGRGDWRAQQHSGAAGRVFTEESSEDRNRIVFEERAGTGEGEDHLAICGSGGV